MKTSPRVANRFLGVSVPLPLSDPVHNLTGQTFLDASGTLPGTKHGPSHDPYPRPTGTPWRAPERLPRDTVDALRFRPTCRPNGKKTLIQIGLGQMEDSGYPRYLWVPLRDLRCIPFVYSKSALQMIPRHLWHLWLFLGVP